MSTTALFSINDKMALDRADERRVKDGRQPHFKPTARVMQRTMDTATSDAHRAKVKADAEELVRDAKKVLSA